MLQQRRIAWCDHLPVRFPEQVIVLQLMGWPERWWDVGDDSPKVQHGNPSCSVPGKAGEFSGWLALAQQARKQKDAARIDVTLIATGDLRVFSIDRRCLRRAHGAAVLLECLLRRAGKLLTRESLISQVWGADYYGDTRTLDVHIKRLRAKIEEDPRNPKHLKTVRGLGYKLEA